MPGTFTRTELPACPPMERSGTASLDVRRRSGGCFAPIWGIAAGWWPYAMLPPCGHAYRHGCVPAMTYSIVARDEASGELGVAVQTAMFAVGSAVPWAR